MTKAHLGDVGKMSSLGPAHTHWAEPQRPAAPTSLPAQGTGGPRRGRKSPRAAGLSVPGAQKPQVPSPSPRCPVLSRGSTAQPGFLDVWAEEEHWTESQAMGVPPSVSWAVSALLWAQVSTCQGDL